MEVFKDKRLIFNPVICICSSPINLPNSVTLFTAGVVEVMLPRGDIL